MMIINLENRDVKYRERLRAIVRAFGERVTVLDDGQCVLVDGKCVDDVLDGDLERWLGRSLSVDECVGIVIGAIGGDETHPSWRTAQEGAQ